MQHHHRQQHLLQPQPSTTSTLHVPGNAAATDYDTTTDNELMMMNENNPVVTAFGSSEERLILTNERSILRKQKQSQNLNMQYIVDLALFLVLTFPYTVMRLVLDLFVKDRIKVNLDFFVLYKLTFFSFHLHMVVKFFLMCAFNVKYRACLARCFSFRPTLCCVDEVAAAEDAKNSRRVLRSTMGTARSRRRHARKLTSDCCCVQLTCMTTGGGGGSSGGGGMTSGLSEDVVGSDVFGAVGADPLSMEPPSALNLRNFDQRSHLMESRENGSGVGMNGELYHSMEFDSTLHKYMHPADPDQESLNMISSADNNDLSKFGIDASNHHF
jgi:hypothetical protein